jgi:hypothetical protein
MMNTHLLLESAGRSLIMGAVVFAALRLLRIHQVRAQRTAWLLALAGALAMPVLVGLHVGPRVLPAEPTLASLGWGTQDGGSSGRADGFAISHGAATLPNAQRPRVGDPGTRRPWGARDGGSVKRGDVGILDPTHRDAMNGAPGLTISHGAAMRRPWGTRMAPVSFAALLYAAVAGFLLLRLAIGLGMALRLCGESRRADFQFGGFLGDIRISGRISTPVTIASTILLPESSAQWDETTLRIVLTHERAHVRQWDFPVQLLAGLHCALFWFNPFSWWLQRQLAALGEAMSDLAAVAEADSRVSYAEVLLEFATNSGWPLTGVAMARSSNLRPRIERLLSDRLFRESSSGKRRLGIVAGAVVVLALVASTSLVRVHAAQTAAAPAPASAADPAKPSALGAPSPDAAVAPSQPGDPDPASTIAPQAVPPAPPAPPANGSASANGTAGREAPSQSDSASGTSTTTDTNIDVDDTVNVSSGNETHSHFDEHGFSYAWANSGDAFALVTGKSLVSFSGNWNEAFQRAMANMSGDFIFYRHDGKSYVTQDPAILARAKALYAPMQQLNRMQAELGARQQALGAEQEALGRRQSEVKIPTPDLKKEMASLEEAMEQLKKLESQPMVEHEALSDLQGKIGDIQGRLGDLQGQAGEIQGKFGEEQGKLGEEQGKLGEEQGRLGEKQGKLAEEAQRQLKPMIEQAIHEGKAKPVE